MGCIEICSSKVAPDRTPTSTAWDVLKWDVLKSVGRKYEKGKLVKYKSACLCTIEHPINELVRVGAIKLADRVEAITRLCTIEHAWGRSRQ